MNIYRCTYYERKYNEDVIEIKLKSIILADNPICAAITLSEYFLKSPHNLNLDWKKWECYIEPLEEDNILYIEDNTVLR